jgi:hypothetical protein
MVIYLYRWKLKKGMEETFQEGWEYITKGLKDHCGSFGSRLHKGNDGIYYGYAQWPDKQTREAANFHDENTEKARTNMSEAVEEAYPEIELNPMADYLIYPRQN